MFVISLMVTRVLATTSLLLRKWTKRIPAFGGRRQFAPYANLFALGLLPIVLASPPLQGGIERITLRIQHLIILGGTLLLVYGAFLGRTSVFKAQEAGTSTLGGWIMTGLGVALIGGMAADLVLANGQLVPKIFGLLLDLLSS